jgi:hypothetical protein
LDPNASGYATASESAAVLMVIPAKRLIVQSLSIISAIFLIWTLVHSDGSSPRTDPLFAPPETRASLNTSFAGLNESVPKWIMESIPKGQVIERQIFDSPPFNYLTHGNGKVVLLMGLTVESLAHFSEVENVHRKIFYNRLDYANHQGTLRLCRLIKAMNSCLLI